MKKFAYKPFKVAEVRMLKLIGEGQLGNVHLGENSTDKAKIVVK